jgi:hypothetical protein
MANNILVFKTNINTVEQIIKADHILSDRVEIKKWNIDIDDCDKVLRIETPWTEIENVLGCLKPYHIYCEELK